MEKRDVAIVGAGYVGLSYALVFASKGYRVLLYDIDSSKINKLKNREIPFYEKSIENMEIPWENLSFSSDITSLEQINILIIAIGTYSNGKFSNKNLFDFFSKISPKNKIFIIKSTVKPGTTRKIKTFLESKGAVYGKDFYLIYNPEFLREGFAIQDILVPNKIVAGINYEEERSIIENLYYFVPNNVPRIFTNWETAEFIKIAQNTFLAIKISFANDLMYIAKIHKLPIDFKTLAKALGLDPRIGEYGLYPGLGFGGSCLPKDSKILAKLEKATDYRLIQEAIKINNKNVDKIIEILEEKYGRINNKKILIVGLSFKEHTDDLRDSKALELAIKLKEKGNDVYWYDEDMKEKKEIFGIKPGKLEDKYDLILITKKQNIQINGIGLRAYMDNFIL